MGLVISECKGLYGQLQWEGGEDCQAVEVSKHQVAVLVAAKYVVIRGDKASYAVAGRLTPLGRHFSRAVKNAFYDISAYQVPTIEGEHVQGVACLVVTREDDVALRSKIIPCFGI